MSCHIIIDIDGAQHPWIPEHLEAWHAGKSAWHHHRGLNKNSLGIELVYTPQDSQPFPEAQIDSLECVLKNWVTRFQIPPTHILGHSDIAPLRKKDPGSTFPWTRLAKKGWGPIAPFLDIHPTPLLDFVPSEEDIHTWLTKIGYVVPQEHSEEALWSFSCHLPASLRDKQENIRTSLYSVAVFK